MSHNKNTKFIYCFTAISLAIFVFLTLSIVQDGQQLSKPRIRSSSSPKSGIKSKAARQEYFHRLLRDPKTNQIPPRMRQSELENAEKIRTSQVLRKKTLGNGISWKFAGPIDVGGRTRALAVDVANSSTLLAGGISGGIWKSTDGGNSWTIKNTPLEPLSVTSLAQDTRDGHTTTWYYSTGEHNGNSAADRGQMAQFYGTGIYKSTDNGESWTHLNATIDNYPNIWNVPSWDLVIRVYVSPITGTIFTANNGCGVFRSTNGGNSFESILNSASSLSTSASFA